MNPTTMLETRSPRRRDAALRRCARMLLAAAACAAGCSSEPDAGATAPERSPAERKEQMLRATEIALHKVAMDARRDAQALRSEFDQKLRALPLPSRLSTTDSALDEFDAPAREARRLTIEKEQVATEARMKALLEHYETAMWLVATEAGKLEHGSQLGFRTGYEELDAKVETTMLQLAREADVEGIAQFATLRTYDHVGLDRVIREELPGLGVYSLYKSQPVKGLFAADQEGQSTVSVFYRDGLGKEVPLSYVQAARRLVERAGIIIAETSWQLDPATPRHDGVVPISPDVDPAKYFVSQEARPAVDTTAPEFEKLRDHVLVSEYRTALRRDDTGELLITIGWQVRWIVDFRGTMRVLVERSDLVLKNDPVLPGLLGKPRPSAHAGS